MRRELFLAVAVAGSQLEILCLHSLSLLQAGVLYQAFLLFDFLGGADVGQVHTRAGFVEGIDGLVREVAVVDITG